MDEMTMKEINQKQKTHEKHDERVQKLLAIMSNRAEALKLDSFDEFISKNQNMQAQYVLR